MLRRFDGFTRVMALDAFCTFSEVTSLTEVVTGVTGSDDAIRDMVVACLSQVRSYRARIIIIIIIPRASVIGTLSRPLNHHCRRG